MNDGIWCSPNLVLPVLGFPSPSSLLPHLEVLRAFTPNMELRDGSWRGLGDQSGCRGLHPGLCHARQPLPAVPSTVFGFPGVSPGAVVHWDHFWEYSPQQRGAGDSWGAFIWCWELNACVCERMCVCMRVHAYAFMCVCMCVHVRRYACACM